MKLKDRIWIEGSGSRLRKEGEGGRGRGLEAREEKREIQIFGEVRRRKRREEEKRNHFWESAEV